MVLALGENVTAMQVLAAVIDKYTLAIEGIHHHRVQPELMHNEDLKIC